MTSEATPCPGCGAMLQPSDGPTHAYLGASPACWAVYGELLAREYSDPAFSRAHQLTVDAYAAQHPGEDGRRQRQSVAVHLVALCLQLELGHGNAATLPYVRQQVADAGSRLPWLDPPPPSAWRMTVADVIQARSPDKHDELTSLWARAVWEAWSPHHDLARAWAAPYVGR